MKILIKDSVKKRLKMNKTNGDFINPLLLNLITINSNCIHVSFLTNRKINTNIITYLTLIYSLHFFQKLQKIKNLFFVMLYTVCLMIIFLKQSHTYVESLVLSTYLH